MNSFALHLMHESRRFFSPNFNTLNQIRQSERTIQNSQVHIWLCPSQKLLLSHLSFNIFHTRFTRGSFSSIITPKPLVFCASRAREPKLRASLGATRGRRPSNIWPNPRQLPRNPPAKTFRSAQGTTAETLQRLALRSCFNVDRRRASALPPGGSRGQTAPAKLARSLAQERNWSFVSARRPRSFATWHLGETCGDELQGKKGKQTHTHKLALHSKSDRGYLTWHALLTAQTLYIRVYAKKEKERKIVHLCVYIQTHLRHVGAVFHSVTRVPPIQVCVFSIVSQCVFALLE